VEYILEKIKKKHAKCSKFSLGRG